ncbi:MAG: hypothetical protein ICV79_11075, partial [Flavisolibacter sp.]|nr:hypothetical protein [Flavisolibacter sp.]
MRIGILGNMNNAYFALTRYLRDAGFDCELFIFKNEPHHFDPACDTRSNDYKKYCRHVTWGDPGDFLKEDFNKIKQELATFDFLIGNGSAPAYVNKIGRKLDIFIPYGYDVYSLPFFRIVHPLRQPAYIAVAYYQRRGIKESSYILFDRTNQAFEAIFNKISINGKRIISPSPMLYYKEYEHEAEQLSEEDALDKQLKRLRRENDLLFVQHTRQLWKNSPDYWSYKGNNLLIEGYAQFIQQYPDLRSKLILFEYGNGVADSKKLISRLNIQDVIVWMPKMPRKKLMHVLSHADLVIGELLHSWLTYGVVMEALSME